MRFIRPEEIEVISHTKRVVPLKHSVYLPYVGITPLEDVDKTVEKANLIYNRFLYESYRSYKSY